MLILYHKTVVECYSIIKHCSSTNYFVDIICDLPTDIWLSQEHFGPLVSAEPISFTTSSFKFDLLTWNTFQNILWLSFLDEIKLLFYPSKTSFLLIATKQQRLKFSHLPTLSLGNDLIPVSSSAHNLGFIFDSAMPFTNQINYLSESYHFRTRDIRRICHLPLSATTALAYSLLLLSTVYSTCLFTPSFYSLQHLLIHSFFFLQSTALAYSLLLSTVYSTCLFTPSFYSLLHLLIHSFFFLQSTALAYSLLLSTVYSTCLFTPSSFYSLQHLLIHSFFLQSTALAYSLLLLSVTTALAYSLLLSATTALAYSLLLLSTVYSTCLFTPSSFYSLQHLLIHSFFFLQSTALAYSLLLLSTVYSTCLFTPSSFYSLQHLLIHSFFLQSTTLAYSLLLLSTVYSTCLFTPSFYSLQHLLIHSFFLQSTALAYSLLLSTVYSTCLFTPSFYSLQHLLIHSFFFLQSTALAYSLLLSTVYSTCLFTPSFCNYSTCLFTPSFCNYSTCLFTRLQQIWLLECNSLYIEWHFSHKYEKNENYQQDLFIFVPSEGGLHEKPNDTCAKMCRRYV